MAKRVTIELAAMVGLGLLMGLIGPFGTFTMSTAERMVVWAVWLLAGYVIFRPAGIVARWLCDATGLPAPLGTALALCVGAFALTLVIATMSMGVGFPAVLRWDGFWWLYFYIMIVSAIVTVTMTALFGRGQSNASEPARPTAAAVTAAVVELASPTLPLPPGFGPVRALKGEDHYVRVIGDGREELILMRLRDAIERLGTTDGLRVHRSWWVARGGVTAVQRDGRAAILTLAGGQEVPVSRDMMPQLRAAGWL
ncbi:MAG: LytTR family DNA-binding domain-containing protein [Sphingopyxis solisilvae]|uniref:LytTR family DNA-binding domain-containing protein n=1 Tax=Sphingopyxis solisilvae TaxID=1886788 RepID=UPI004037176A